jgi:hypothetical protein
MINPWVKGLLSAAVSGSGGILASMVLDPTHFDSTHPRHLAIVAGIGAIIGVGNYLQHSPLTTPHPPAPTP